MSLSRRRRYALAVSIACPFLLVAAAALAWFARPLFPPPRNAYVGQTREQVIQHWGQPDDEWDGPYGNPNRWKYIEERYGPSRTLRFDRWRGSLYVEVHEENDEWVCFSSNWVPKGMIID